MMYKNYFCIHNIVAPKEAHKILIKNHSMFHICNISIFVDRSFDVLCDTDTVGQNTSRYNGHSAPVLTYKTYHHMPHFSGVVTDPSKIDRCNGHSAPNLTDKIYAVMLIILVFSQLE